MIALPPAGGGWLTNRKMTCADDDPLCDFGPAGDHACTFRMSLCFNVTQSPLCTPTDVASVRVLRPGARATDVTQIADRKALSDALVAMGGQVQATSIVFSPSLQAKNTCTPLANIKVPLAASPTGKFRQRTQQLLLRTAPTGSLGTNASFALTCRPHL